MALTAKSNGGGDFELAPTGNHASICYAVIDLGEHETDWQGKTSTKHRVRVSWELCDELMSDGRPFSISKEYTLSLNEKATLRHDLESWRGRPFTEQELAGFDLFAVLGAPCMVNVIHQPKRDGTGSYAKLSGVAKMPKGMQPRERVNALLRFAMEEADAAAIYAEMPDWLRQRINFRTPEDAPASQDGQEMIEDEIPF